jgi:hypothetical protein
MKHTVLRKNKKGRVPKYRSLAAHSLEDKQFRPKVIKDKTKYTRKGDKGC